MLELKELRFAYPGMKQPYAFTMQAEPGQITLIAGRSGSGKSTLLDLVAGFQTPSSGAVVLDGQNLLSLPAEARPVSILFQKDNLFDHLTVAENLSLGLPRNTPKQVAHAGVTDVLVEVAMSEFAARRTAHLSGGQQQRVALARTLLRKKPVLLLDEPFANLDGETADEMRHLVKSLTRRENWHTIVVSHLSEDAETLADKAYWLEDSTLVSA